MTITETAEYARQCFLKLYPDKNRRGQIILAFMRDELQMSPANLKELITEGKTSAPESALTEDYSVRLFLWIYINYLSTPKDMQSGN